MGFLDRINSIKINWYKRYLVSVKKTSLTYLINITFYTSNTCGLSILLLSVLFQILNIAWHMLEITEAAVCLITNDRLTKAAVCLITDHALTKIVCVID